MPVWYTAFIILQNDNMTTDENKSDEAAVGAADRKDKKSKTKTQVIDLPIEESIPWPYSTVQITSFKDIEVGLYINVILMPFADIDATDGSTRKGKG